MDRVDIQVKKDFFKMCVVKDKFFFWVIFRFLKYLKFLWESGGDEYYFLYFLDDEYYLFCFQIQVQNMKDFGIGLRKSMFK